MIEIAVFAVGLMMFALLLFIAFAIFSALIKLVCWIIEILDF